MVGTVMDIPPLLRRLLIGGASSFNGDLSKWNGAEVTDMNRMIAPASSFNGDLSKWDVTRSLTWIPWAESWADGYHDDGKLQCRSPLPPEARGRGAVGWYAVGWLVGTGPLASYMP